MIDYPEGEIFCPIDHKKLTTENDKERGYHYEISLLFCEDDEF